MYPGLPCTALYYPGISCLPTLPGYTLHHAGRRHRSGRYITAVIVREERPGLRRLGKPGQPKEDRSLRAELSLFFEESRPGGQDRLGQERTKIG